MSIRTALLLAGLFGLLLVAGCADQLAAPPPPVDPAPPRNSAASLVKRVEWDWQRFEATDYVGLLAGDFRYVPAEGDSAGAAWGEATPWNREIERLVMSRMFDRAPGTPPVLTSLALNFDRTMIALPDPRPGKDSRWHRSVRTHIDLRAQLDTGRGYTDVEVVVGNALVFLVRGDSVSLTPDQVLEGATHDSTQWWIERWEDETLSGSGSGLHATPANSFTLTMLKSLFLPVRDPLY